MIEDIVREGKVIAVNESKRIAKVWFEALGIESDWLPVLINHDLMMKPYMPKGDDLVLVLYFPVFNGDGIILGGIKPWK